MKKRILALVIVLGLLGSALPTFLFPATAAAADYYTFHNIEPAAQVTPAHNDTWETINATTYGVPIGATGIIYKAINWEGSGGDDEPFGIRKHGSTDNRINPLWEHTPTWGLIGVDENCLFDLYSGSATNSFAIWIIGYTTVGVTFFTNAYDKSVGTGWHDIDCSTEAPSAVGLIFEVVGPSRGTTMTYFGLRPKGSTNGFVYNAADHLAPGCMIGCDANQVVEAYNGGYYHFYLIGYVYDGAYFYTNGIAQGPSSANAWVDLNTALPAGSVMGFYEFRGSGSAYCHDIRANGSAHIYQPFDNRHCWAYAGCDAAGLVEGYVQSTTIDYFLIGYACPGSYYVSTQDATDVDSISATFHGTVTNNNSEEVELRGFQWGLTQTPTWQWYETGSSEFFINPSSTNFMYNAAGGYVGLGQRITMAYNVTSLSFNLKKTGNPTGDISYRIDKVAWGNVWNSVLFDASNLTGALAWYTITFNETLELAGDYRLYTRFTGGDALNYVEHGYRAANVGDGVYTRDIFPLDGSWSDSGAQEAGIKFDYQSSAAYELGSYNYTITGLAGNTQYFYRAYMVTSGGTYYGQWMPFGTANQPMMTTIAASSVAMTTAKLNSLVDADGGEPVTIRFGWGNSTQTAIEDYQYFNTVSGTFFVGEHPYLNIASLDPSTTYYFRVEGTNVNGSTTGDELSFTTTDLTGAVENFRGIGHTTYIDLSWDALVGASNYLIRYTYGGFTNSTTGGFEAYFDSTPSARHTDLDPGTPIYYTIWGESGGYYGAPAYLLLTTTSGTAGTGEFDTLPDATGWLAAPDYEHLSGVPILYPIVNGMADMMGAPRANAWVFLAVFVAVVAGLWTGRKFGLAIGLGVMVFFMFLGLVLGLLPLWMPIVSLVLSGILAYTRHKEFSR